MTEAEQYKYFEFLIDHTVCELKEMVKTEKDPEKKEIIEDTIGEAEARNMKCVAYAGLITMEEAHAVHGEHCVKLHCVRCGDTITCRCSAPKVEVNGICGQCEKEIEAVDKEEKTPKKDTKKYWKEMALFDNLTDLPNRNAFDLTLEEQKDEFGYIGIFDIDHFKKINDEYGHDAGDMALKTLADFLIRKIPVFRWGGEEFVFLMPKDDPQAVEDLLNEIREEVKTITFEQGFNISVSVGFAPYDQSKNVEEQFKSADKALYCAKEGGRDMVVAYEDGMDCTAHKDGEEGLVKNDACETPTMSDEDEEELGG